MDAERQTGHQWRRDAKHKKNTDHPDVSDAGASMDEKGRGTLESCPPDLDSEESAVPWYGLLGVVDTAQ